MDPDRIFLSYQILRNLFCIVAVCQIFYAVMDQKLFGEQSNPQRDTVSVVAELKREYTSWKHVEGTHWHARFMHLLNYGAGKFGDPKFPLELSSFQMEAST